MAAAILDAEGSIFAVEKPSEDQNDEGHIFKDGVADIETGFEEVLGEDLVDGGIVESVLGLALVLDFLADYPLETEPYLKQLALAQLKQGQVLQYLLEALVLF